MRLTLRTLLAYLDDTLPAAAAKEIGQKLTESPVAQELVTRIREVTRRRRIVAPAMSGDEINPNEMAEYLDNLLNPQAVEVIENVCLQSDSHLAEAAACHQILTMIGQPAVVSDPARRRMYDLVRGPEPSAARPDAAAPPMLPVTSIFSQRPLLARVLSVAAVVVGALVIGGLIWVSLKVPGQGAARSDKQVAATDEPDGGIFRPEAPSADTSEVHPPELPLSKPDIKPLTDSTPDQMPAEETESPGPAGKAEEKPSEENPDKPAKAESSATDVAAPGTKSPPAPAADTAKPEPETAAPAQPAAPIKLGVYASTSGVLMRHDRPSREWRRLAQRSELFTQDALLCLPTFRGLIEFAPGPPPDGDRPAGQPGAGEAAGGQSLELVGSLTAGETELSLEPPGEDAHVRVQLDRGRIVLGTNREAAKFAIQFLDQSWSVTLKGPETVVGVELTAPWKPGKPPVFEATVYLPRGEAEFRSRDRVDQLGGPVQLRWSSAGGFRDRESLAATPAWLDKEEMPVLVVKASEAIRKSIPENASAVLRLIEAVGDERRETRLLAVQCLGAIAKLPPLIDAMSTPERREVRQEAIRTLRQYLARGQAQEAILSDALLAKLNKSVDRATSMLWLLRGLTDEESKQDERYDLLISLLDSADLAVRELAINNLEELAGKPTNVNYSPDLRNENAISAWRRFLDEKRLPPKNRGKM